MEAFEAMFHELDQAVEEVMRSAGVSYLEAVPEALGAFAVRSHVRGLREEKRKAVQAVLIKGMRQSAQPHHQMTPDGLGLLVGYFLHLLTGDSTPVALLDPASGTGNLLFTALPYAHAESRAVGVEIDETLARIAKHWADVLEIPLALYRQDALGHLLIDPVDAVVCDLPIGYYPDDEVAAFYELRAPQGHTYAHHLFIEQSLRYAKGGAYLYFLAPENLFESEQKELLHAYLKRSAYIQAVVRLPHSLFRAEAHAKCLLILQKRGDGVERPREVLLAQAPSLANFGAMKLFFAKVQQWKRDNK